MIGYVKLAVKKKVAEPETDGDASGVAACEVDGEA